MRRVVPIAVLPLMLLSACSGAPATYDSPEALQGAYTDAGGECSSPVDVPESMTSEGTHGMLCDDATMLLVFDDQKSQDRYEALTGASDADRLSGERWSAIAIGDVDLSSYTQSLGGEFKHG